MSQAPENPPEKPPEDKHSPRPWKAQPWYGGGILDNDGKLIGYHYKPGDFSWDTHQANRRLILDAVNGQPALQRYNRTLTDTLDRVISQRDELVVLCNDMLALSKAGDDAVFRKRLMEIGAVKEALDKIKGEK